MDGGWKGGGDEPGDGGDDGHDRRGVLIGLIVVAALVVGGVYLINLLRASSRLQDCEMQGRTNCAPVAAQDRQ
jgi:hypothetical protein